LSIPGLLNQVKLRLKPAIKNRTANPFPRAPIPRRAYTESGWQLPLLRGYA